jgi:hypothetical protein
MFYHRIASCTYFRRLICLYSFLSPQMKVLVISCADRLKSSPIGINLTNDRAHVQMKFRAPRMILWSYSLTAIYIAPGLSVENLFRIYYQYDSIGINFLLLALLGYSTKSCSHFIYIKRSELMHIR